MVLSKDDFMMKLKDRIGDDNSDEAIAFMEDVVDTYNDLEGKANSDGEDWKSKYDELDKSWREKYKARFFDSPAEEVIEEQKEDVTDDGEEKTFDDLFVEREG